MSANHQEAQLSLDSCAKTADGEFSPEIFAARTGCSNQALHDIERYRALLEASSQHFNLIGPSVLSNFWRRHAFDSAQLLDVAPRKRVWMDIGAGAGFPGVILAIMLRDMSGARVHLVEKLAKRAKFLTDVVAQLQLSAVVQTTLAQNLTPPPDLEVVTARACAPLNRLLDMTAPVIKGQTIGLFLKGRSVNDEVKGAQKAWKFKYELIDSRSDVSGRILRIEGLDRVQR